MDAIMNLIRDYGMPAVFVLITLEYACFPLPSEIVLPFAGAVAVGAGVSFPTILLLATAGGLIGSFICYAIGRFGGVAVMHWLVGRFPKMKRGLDYSQRQFDRYALLSVGVGRVIPLCRTYISFVAGLARQNPLAFALSSGVGIVVWNSVLLGIGYFFSDNWEMIIQYYNDYKIVVILLLGAALVVFGGYRYYRYSKAKSSPKPPKK
ncbi:MAG: DedA family protein [Acetanaerobacterium sp.]